MPFSLYELALNTEPSPQPFSVSPSTLKSMVGALIDVLIEQKISATFWVKLPPGEVWSSEMERYRQQADVPHKIYVCSYSEDLLTELISNQDNQKEISKSQIKGINLAKKSKLIPEYFVLFLADNICGLILAHRSHKVKNTELEEQEKKAQLLVISDFSVPVVQTVLTGIKQAIATNIDPSTQTVAEELLTNWDSLFKLPASSEPAILTQIWAKQLQRQEEIRRNALKDRTLAAKTAILERQNEALLNDLMFKDELLSNVAQEMRTPLTNMKTALTLIEAAHLKAEQRKRYMHLLQTECDRQSSLINGLLELVQLDRVPQQTAPQTIHLADIVPGVVSTYQAIAQEKGIQLGYTVSANLPSVCCSEAWLRQIVINLLHNSIKFTPTSGQVWVKAKQQGEYIQLEFRDTGIGIAPNELPKIFDRFYRGRAVSSEDTVGAGLGLTIVQQLLLRCGGSISVTSKLGEGATFKVLLPIVKEEK